MLQVHGQVLRDDVEVVGRLLVLGVRGHDPDGLPPVPAHRVGPERVRV